MLLSVLILWLCNTVITFTYICLPNRTVSHSGAKIWFLFIYSCFFPISHGAINSENYKYSKLLKNVFYSLRSVLLIVWPQQLFYHTSNSLILLSIFCSSDITLIPCCFKLCDASLYSLYSLSCIPPQLSSLLFKILAYSLYTLPTGCFPFKRL